MITIDCINRSTVVTDTQFTAFLTAQQKQLDNEFSREWGTTAHLAFKVPVPANAWQFILLDTSDQVGAAGYHQLMKQSPIGYAFAKTDQEHGLNWTVTCSHEIMEMLADPDVNRVVLLPYHNTIRLYAYEVCDAVEADKLGKQIDGILLSDFVMRRWFELGATGQMDAYNHITRPLELASGGYIGYFDFQTGWNQLTKAHEFSRVGLRRQYRFGALPTK